MVQDNKDCDRDDMSQKKAKAKLILGQYIVECESGRMVAQRINIKGRSIINETIE